MPTAPSSRRLGQGTLTGVVVLLAALTLIAASQFFSAGAARVAVERTNLTELADLQAQSYASELRAAFLHQANTQGTALFEKLRKKLDTRWQEIDCTAELHAPTQSVEPRWGSADGELDIRLSPRLLRYRVALRSPRTYPGGEAAEEWVALLTLEVDVEASDIDRTHKTHLLQSFESRLLRPGPPPPFDQLGLMVSDLSALTDLTRAKDLRARLLEDHEALRQMLLRIAPRNPRAEPRLKELAQGMKPPEEVDALTPKLPEGVPAVFGPYHLHGKYSAGTLNLAERMAARRGVYQAKVAKVEPLADSPAKDLERAAFEAVASVSLALDEVWRFHWQFPLRVPGTPEHQSQLAPFLPQLSALSYQARAHRVIPSDAPLWKAWTKGELRADGVYLVPNEAGPTFELSGTYRGRVALVVDGGRVRLGNLTPANPEGFEDLLTIVSLGADVAVEGDTQASVMMLPPRPSTAPGTLRIGIGATLTGKLLAPSAQPGTLELSGSLADDARFRLPLPPSKALEFPGGGPYVVVVDPTPIFQEPGAKS